MDLWPVYINTQGIDIGGKLRRAGEEIDFFNPSRHGVRFVANSVVSTRKLVQQAPETVQRFVRALLEGWRQAMDPANASRAVAVVGKVDRDTRPQVLQTQLDATRKLIAPTDAAVIGKMDVPAWRQTESIMLTYGQIDEPVEVEKSFWPPPASD